MEGVDKSDGTGSDQANKSSVPPAGEPKVSTFIADRWSERRLRKERWCLRSLRRPSVEAKWEPQGLRASGVGCQISSQVHATIYNDTSRCYAIPCYM
jgi:hypothetical protein